MQSLIQFRGRLLIVCLAVGLVMIALVFPFPMHGRVWSLIFDLAHAPVFCALTLTFAGCLDPGSIGLSDRYAVIRKLTLGLVLILCASLLLLGLAGEILQAFAGRSPAVGDLLANLAGIAAAAFWIRTTRSRGGLRWLAVGVLLFAISLPVFGLIDAWHQRSEFPVLASFERRMETTMWDTRHAVTQRSQDWASHGDYSLQVTLTPKRYSGISLAFPMPNWQGYRQLLIDLHNPGSIPIHLRLKVADYQHQTNGYRADQRYESSFEIGGNQTMTLVTQLVDIRDAPVGRLLQMDQITLVEVYAVEPAESRTFYIDNLRLEGQDRDRR